jgi:hypothetical protein
MKPTVDTMLDFMTTINSYFAGEITREEMQSHLKIVKADLPEVENDSVGE